MDDVILVNFVHLTDNEKEMVRNWRNNGNVRKWMFTNHIISQEEHSKFIYGLMEDNRNLYWLVKDKTGEYIGVISLNRVDLKNKNAYLGIYSNPERKMPGVGRLLIECLKDLSFDLFSFHTLKLEVIDCNERAIDFYKKSGFSKEGRLKQFVLKDGKWYDMIVMGILNRDRI